MPLFCVGCSPRHRLRSALSSARRNGCVKPRRTEMPLPKRRQSRQMRPEMAARFFPRSSSDSKSGSYSWWLLHPPRWQPVARPFAVVAAHVGRVAGIICIAHGRKSVSSELRITDASTWTPVQYLIPIAPWLTSMPSPSITRHPLASASRINLVWGGWESRRPPPARSAKFPYQGPTIDRRSDRALSKWR
jgi:hypothetical protein